MTTYNVGLLDGGPGETGPVTVEVKQDGDGDEFLALSVPDGFVLEGEQPGMYYVRADEGQAA